MAKEKNLKTKDFTNPKGKVNFEIKTTEQIHLLLEMNNYGEPDISKKTWVSIDGLINVLDDIRKKLGKDHTGMRLFASCLIEYLK